MSRQNQWTIHHRTHLAPAQSLTLSFPVLGPICVPPIAKKKARVPYGTPRPGLSSPRRALTAETATKAGHGGRLPLIMFARRPV